MYERILSEKDRLISEKNDRIASLEEDKRELREDKTEILVGIAKLQGEVAEPKREVDGLAEKQISA